MTHSICEDAKENDTVQLIDKRPNADGTYPKYWVAKLADSNCWMTQNLDLDIPASGLTAALSDMTVDWNSSSTYKPVATKTTTADWISTNDATGWNTVQSYNPGIKVCDAANGCNEPITSDYNAHYAVGNYYSWLAATAGSGGSSGSASSSICPKNWALPANGAYGNLFTSYGEVSSSNKLMYGEQSILNAPLYFVYGGFIYNVSVADAGIQGRYWSSTAYGGTYAYFMFFSTSGASPSGNNNYRYFGMSVRCVAR